MSLSHSLSTPSLFQSFTIPQSLSEVVRRDEIRDIASPPSCKKLTGAAKCGVGLFLGLGGGLIVSGIMLVTTGATGADLSLVELDSIPAILSGLSAFVGGAAICLPLARVIFLRGQKENGDDDDYAINPKIYSSLDDIENGHKIDFGEGRSRGIPDSPVSQTKNSFESIEL